MGLPFGAIQEIIVMIIAFILSIIALWLRLWSRHIQNVCLVFNDYMVIFATIINAGAVANNLASCITGGLGLHLQDLQVTDPDRIVHFLKVFVAGQLLWASANTCVKFSILSLYTDIFPGKRFGYICRGTMVITSAYWIMVFLEGFLLCRPVQYNWDKSIPGGECQGESLAYLVAAITNLVIDAFIVILPMPMLFRLQLSLLKKFCIAGMFSLGIVICIMSLLRVVWVSDWDLSDLTYTVIPVAIYSMLEPFLGVVNACLPTIRPALARLFSQPNMSWTKKVFKSTTTSTSGTGQYHRQPSTNNHVPDHNFEQLKDDIPLVGMRSASNQNVSRELEEANTITVTRAWEVGRSS